MLIDLHECYGYSFDPLKKDMDRAKFFYDEALQARFMKLWRQIAERFKDYPEQVAFEPLNEVVLAEVKDAWNDIVTRYIQMMGRSYGQGLPDWISKDFGFVDDSFAGVRERFIKAL